MSELKDHSTVYLEFEEHLAFVRNKLASLWYTARDQTQDPPAFDRGGALESIDDDTAEISVTLNFIETNFRTLSELARKGGAT